MRLNGCLEKKIKVIGLLENFSDDFEKKLEIFEFSKKGDPTPPQGGFNSFNVTLIGYDAI